jgi:hypothetical protein
MPRKEKIHCLASNLATPKIFPKFVISKEPYLSINNISISNFFYRTMRKSEIAPHVINSRDLNIKMAKNKNLFENRMKTSHVLLAASVMAGKFPAGAKIMGETEHSYSDIFSISLQEGNPI